MQIQQPSLFLLCAATAAMLTTGARAQTLVRSVTGPAANARYGKACIRITDQNGDGFKDLLVGAPGFNGERGAIYCLSGAYVALGGGTQTLWSVTPTTSQGDLFGYALAEIGDITGDGVKDFLVGEPGYDTPSLNDVGAVRLVNGATHAVGQHTHGVQQGCMLGSAIDSYDATQVVVAAPGPNSAGSSFGIGPVAQFIAGGPMSFVVANGTAGVVELGASIAAVPDLNGDGHPEVVAGLPGLANNTGGVHMYFPFGTTPTLNYYSSIAGERLGASVDARHDYDGDGAVDIVVGAPNSPNVGTVNELGRVVVLSGAKLAAHTPPYEIYTFTTPPAFGTLASNFHFGAAVRACEDLNGDGIGEILVGAPDYTSNQFTGVGRGFVAIYSGATGAQLAKINGAQQEHFGDSLAGALQDLEGDGFKEFVVAGSLSDTGASDSGIVKCYRLFPLTPSTFCVGKVNSLGCTPAISFSGTPDATPGAPPFLITASSIINQKSGILFYSHAPTSIAFQGGLKCVAQPSKRTPQQNSGGSASGADCTGAYSFDFNARIQSAVDPTLTAGAEVFAQYWSRDPLSATTTSLSDALRFVINP